ncbi:MAG: LapA family protein [Cyanobacteria bacterium P01_F01_bin.33]
MRVLGLLFAFVIIAIAAIFASQNPQMVSIRWFALSSVDVPVGLVLVAAACGGCGVVATVANVLRPQFSHASLDGELARRVERLESY